jgi:Kef-type K+ transport system membrane component KefB
MDHEKSVFHVLLFSFLLAIVFIIKSSEKLFMAHYYSKEICAFTIIAVPLFYWLKGYLPRRFKLNESGDILE